VPRLRSVANRVAVGTCAALAAACGGGGHGHLVTAASVAPTTTVVVTTTTIPPVTYTVKRGDTLSSIAKHFGDTVEALVAANHIVEANLITQGQVLVIPPPPTPPPTTTVGPSVSSTVAAVPTTTVAAVPAGPAALVITPAHAQVGNVFNFKVTGTKPDEAVTFEIDSPDGTKSTGQPHPASAKGTVLASYLTTQANGPGLYTVIATGSRGTSVRSSFRIDPPTS
jgi:LysM repeat protein